LNCSIGGSDARRNVGDMNGLLRYGRRPHIGPKEVETIGQLQFQVGAALSADRWRPARSLKTYAIALRQGIIV